MKKLNILFLQATPVFGGDTKVQELLVRFMDRQVANVHVACLDEKDGYEPRFLRNISSISDTHIIPIDLGFNIELRTLSDAKRAVQTVIPAISSLASLVRYVRKNKIDIIHSLDRVRDASCNILLSLISGAKSVIHMHAKMGYWTPPIARAAMKRADALVGVSQFVIESGVSVGFRREKMHRIWNGIELVPTVHCDVQAVHDEFNIPSDVPIVIFTGRFNVWKAPDKLVRSLAKVKEQGGNFRLLMVGEEDTIVPLNNRVSVPFLKKIASDLGVADRIIFTGFRNDVPRLLAASDIYAMPTFEEPFALVFLEAMAMGKPIVAIESGGVPELVEHGKSGLLSAPDDIDNFAANVAFLLGDAGRRTEMGRNARRRIEEHFTARHMAKEVERLYQKLMDPIR